MDSTDAVSQLKALNARFMQNFVTNDVPSHDQITHRDFVCITTKGAFERKEAYLKRWASGFDPNVNVYWDYRDESISVYGDVALVRAVTKYTVVRPDGPVTGMTAYTDTYVKEDGTWLCVQAQLTPVAPDFYPDDSTIIRQWVKGVPVQNAAELLGV
jgi:ketosteroid isomerase-like protein